MNKKILCMLLIIICLIIGCSLNPMLAVYDNDKKIASATNSYTLNNIEQSFEEKHFTASVEKMEGMDTIWVFDAKEDKTLDITYTLNVTSGKMKLALISPDGEVSVIGESGSGMTDPIQSTFHVKSGNNRIKIVAGENTAFTVDITISDGEFQELG